MEIVVVTGYDEQGKAVATGFPNNEDEKETMVREFSELYARVDTTLCEDEGEMIAAQVGERPTVDEISFIAGPTVESMTLDEIKKMTLLEKVDLLSEMLDPTDWNYGSQTAVIHEIKLQVRGKVLAEVGELIQIENEKAAG